MSQTDAGARIVGPDIVYSGRRGAWMAIILLALFDGGMLLVCGPAWDVITAKDDPAGIDELPLPLWPVALAPFAILAVGVAFTILAVSRVWNGRPRLVLAGKALTYQGVFLVRQADWSDLGEFILWRKRDEVSDDSGIGPSTRTVETTWLAAPLSGRRRWWLFWRRRQFRLPDSFDATLAQIQGELNRHVRGPGTDAHAADRRASARGR